jgi:hypothetical protein
MELCRAVNSESETSKRSFPSFIQLPSGACKSDFGTFAFSFFKSLAIILIFSQLLSSSIICPDCSRLEQWLPP